MSVHEDVFRRSNNLTDANSAASRKADEPAPDTSYLLLGAGNDKYPDGLTFGGVNLGKRYVSYHLMCTYFSPDLLQSMSPELRKRRQGKSCFNFTRVDQALFDELSDITTRGREQFISRGWAAHSPASGPERS